MPGGQEAFASKLSSLPALSPVNNNLQLVLTQLGCHLNPIIISGSHKAIFGKSMITAMPISCKMI